MVDQHTLETSTIALKDAARVLDSFPAVKKIESIVSDSESLTIKALWAVTLPTKFREAGVTTSGVRSLESVHWVFPFNYPLDAPNPTLRSDFPTSLPHINPFEAGNRVPPCIAELSLEDLLHSAGLEAILQAMTDWLEHAASGELHCPVQGWEAIRRDSVSGIVSADTYAIRSELEAKVIPARYFEYRYLYWDATKKYGLGVIDTPSLGSSNSDFKSRRTFILRESLLRNGPALLLQTQKGVVVEDYWPETVTDFGGLRSLAKRLGLLDVLDARVKYLLSVSGPEACLEKNKRPIEEFLIVFAIKRPFSLIGTDSHWELLPYRVCYAERAESMLPESTSVFAPIFISSTSPALLQSVSGQVAEEPTHLTILGCGSVGSKLSLHLAKTGRYVFKLLDDDHFSSHNNARHGVIADGLNCIGASKTSLLQSEIHKLNIAVDIMNGDVIKLSAEGKNIFPKHTKFIVDTTASLRVRHWLSHYGYSLPGRLIHTVLYGNAAMGALAIEDSDRTVRIDDMTAYLNTLCIENDHIRTAMYGSKRVSRQVFSGGCSSVTARMSDIDISLMTTALTSQIDRFIAGDRVNNADAKLTIGLVNADLSLDWLHFQFPETVTIPKDESFDWNIRILGWVHKEVEEQANADVSKEQGGVLAGHVCSLSRTIYVTHLVAAPQGSVRTPTRFFLKTDGLKEKFQDIHSKTNGQISFLGTWHSHTTQTPPSPMDKATLAELTENYDLPIVMLTYTGGRLVRV